MTVPWRRLWRPALGLALLVAVLLTVDPARVGALLSAADPALVLVGVIGLAAVHLVPAAGWRAIVAAISGTRLPWRAALSVYYAAQAIGGVTPANLGGDIHRAAALRDATDRWSVAVAPLVVQRATSYLALSALSLLAVVAIAAQAAVAGPIVAVGGLVAALVAAAAWLLLAPPRGLRGIQAWLIRLVGGSVPAAAADGRGPARLGRATVIGLVQGLAFHALGVGLTWLLVLAVDPSLTSVAVPAAITLARLSLAVPISPSGLGIQEGALAGLFAALGLAPDVALAGLLLARLGLVLTTIIGAALLMRAGPGLGDLGAAGDVGAVRDVGDVGAVGAAESAEAVVAPPRSLGRARLSRR